MIDSTFFHRRDRGERRVFFNRTLIHTDKHRFFSFYHTETPQLNTFHCYCREFHGVNRGRRVFYGTQIFADPPDSPCSHGGRGEHRYFSLDRIYHAMLGAPTAEPSFHYDRRGEHDLLGFFNFGRKSG